jgi:hypothetical protein
MPLERHSGKVALEAKHERTGLVIDPDSAATKEPADRNIDVIERDRSSTESRARTSIDVIDPDPRSAVAHPPPTKPPTYTPFHKKLFGT